MSKRIKLRWQGLEARERYICTNGKAVSRKMEIVAIADIDPEK